MKNPLPVLVLLVFQALLLAAPCVASVAVDEEEVVFTLRPAAGGRAFLVGDFNGWNPTIDLMVAGEGGFEIRLYLLPGKYRYRFIVDGVSRSDPDNPCLDKDGNSCFTLVEKDGVLEAVLAEAVSAQGALSRMRIAPSGAINASVAGGASDAFFEGVIKGVIDEKIDVDCSVGSTQEYHGEGPARGEAFLARGLAAYRFDRGTLRAFSRHAIGVESGDPLRLFGRVGPYRYPLGIFCRGMNFEGTLPLGVETSLLYASRISGYTSGLEGTASSWNPLSRRDFTDSDVIGVKLGAKRGRTAARYLLRQDRRPVSHAWYFAPFGDGLYRGFERMRAQGVWLSFAGAITVEGELLIGRNYVAATKRSTDGGSSFEDVSLEEEWERSSRFHLGVSRAGEKIRSSLSFTGTGFGGEIDSKIGWHDGSRSSIDGVLSYEEAPLSISLQCGYETYSDHNTGAVFRLGRNNFWLDGDELSYDLIPFLSARNVYEMKLSCVWNRDVPGDLPWGSGLELTMLQRGDPRHRGPLFREIGLSRGMELHPRADFLLDMRGVSYEYGNIRRDFVEAYLSLRGRITRSLWCAIGTGVNPYAFDRRLYAYSDHGREEYLAERGIFEAYAGGGEAAAVKTLIDAEEALSEDWVVTFEAGFTF